MSGAGVGGAPKDLQPAETLRFSTGVLPERERIEVFCDFFARRVMRVHAEPLVRESFYAEVQLRALPGLGFVSMRQSAAKLGRTKELVSDGDDSIILTRFSIGALQRHLGREAVMEAGDLAVCPSAEIGGATLPAESKGICLVVPRTPIGSMLRSPDDWFARPVSRRSPALQLLMRYLDNLTEESATATPALQQLVVAHVHDLVALALGANRDSAELARTRGLRAARLHAIKKDLTENCRGDVRVATIAAHHRLTPRYVQRLFEEEGTTFTEFLRGERLEHARRMLTSPRFAHFRIADIAFESGFGDLSYFHRMFQRRYGISPADLRNQSRDRPYERR